ncbi:MAG: ABC transporter substrate-binding protein, partial [bacterium]|nr:ABC transporter substrate-binding protein [bacterium]
MKLRKKMVWTLIVLVGIALFGAGSTALAESPKRGGKLVVAFGADHRGLEPHYAIGWETLWLSMNLYNSLVGLSEKYEIVPEIAKSWEVSTDGLTYTFHLH